MRRRWFAVAVAMILSAAFLMVSCAKETIQSQSEPQPQTTTPVAGKTDDGKQTDARLLEEQRLRAEREREAAVQAARSAFVAEKILFEFDSVALTEQARRILNQKAEFLAANTGIRITIEGHCDERGTEAYNMALGERRADAVRNYLIHMGTSVERLNIVSYGEEKPIVAGQDESAWSQNRRAQFVIH